ncbi:Short-chain dehydrogenase TIC 32, chloroplastic isoform X2 [Aphelenchoides fujianensis]|nr:Short-chain dehydrogenase TIC 32, chloroplastic isoform X2 [Aphelenchoides fujianensis]
MMNRRENFSPGGMQVYSRTKLANILHAMELTKRLRERNPSTRVTVNALHPGYVRTNIIKSESILRKLLYPVNYFFSKNVVQGVQTSLFVALSPQLERSSGQYYDDSALATKHRLAHDESLARRFYDDCYRAVGLESQQVISSL